MIFWKTGGWLNSFLSAEQSVTGSQKMIKLWTQNELMIHSLVKSIITEVMNPAGRSSVQVAQCQFLAPTLRKKSESLGKTTSTQAILPKKGNHGHGL